MSFVTAIQEGAILTLTLDRPAALNALNAQVLDDIDRALDNLDLAAVRWPDSPGEPGMQPRNPCLPWRGILGPGHTPR